jgi:serine/threonine-protein kinase/endoribonuclease IRE1
MIALDPAERPIIHQVINHPLFWSAERKLAYMQDLSDWLEVHEDMDGAYEAAVMC